MKKVKNNKLIRFTIRILGPFLAFLFFLWLLILGLNSFINNASYFKVKKVTFIGLDEKKIARRISEQLLFDNIFVLDTKEARENIKIQNPQFYDVEIVRNLPDELTVKIVRRKPMVQIKQRGFFLVDWQGVIVSDVSRRPFDEFIIITGLDGISKLSFGKKISAKEFSLGLKLAKELEKINADLVSLVPQLTHNNDIIIDLSKYPSFYVYLGDLELRFHQDYLQKQIRSLMKVLLPLNKKIKQVKYIDLRFGDPVVSF